MAIETAKRYCIPLEIIQRAEALAESFDELCRPSAGGNSSLSALNPSSFAPVVKSTPNDRTIHSVLIDITSVQAVMFQVWNVLWESIDSDPSPEDFSATEEKLKLLVMRPSQKSPPSYEGQSCVYVLLLSQQSSPPLPPPSSSPYRQEETSSSLKWDALYVGETESLQQRIKAHRSKYKHCAVSVLAAKMKNKSISRKFETLLINELRNSGYYLENIADGRHVLFSV